MEVISDVKTINLVDGTFTPSEAHDVIQALIDQKINFHKFQRLSWCEGDINADTQYPDGRIAELIEEKKKAKELIAELRKEGKKLRIDGILKISVEE
ncbi:hypothetical protein [Flagellimonas lutaonensis]|uniref:Uncharacterized protein n=1 Tax=Flagellimonas lutaonensis TaxID=516051 RepID=A0A0D5YS51_9FLAO|nr:hypothetical protein [Allomuricauda lutaonensis]AKA34744.1 hypothetical protein VC82_1100 [Allomuricauda lutaonensis]